MPETRSSPLICCMHGGRWYAHFMRLPEVKGHGTTRRQALENLGEMLAGELNKDDQAALSSELKTS